MILFLLLCSSDTDAGNNALLSYSLIQPGDTNAFLINPTTGIITSKVSFDRETKDSYTLTVRARDHGQSPLEDTATVDITILDVNDNKPAFTNLPTTKNVPEDKNVGEALFFVAATDPDKGK